MTIKRNWLIQLLAVLGHGVITGAQVASNPEFHLPAVVQIGASLVLGGVQLGAAIKAHRSTPAGDKIVPKLGGGEVIVNKGGAAAAAAGVGN